MGHVRLAVRDVPGWMRYLLKSDVKSTNYVEEKRKKSIVIIYL